MNQKAAPVFVLRKGQTQANLEILNHVAQHQPCSFLQLSEKFGQSSSKGLKARLSYLALSDQLQADKTGCSMDSWTFALGEMAGKRSHELGAASKTIQPAQQAQAQAQAQAQRRDLAPKGTWTAPRCAALRAGASDFSALPSLRNGQRVPFSPGYVSLTSQNKE